MEIRETKPQKTLSVRVKAAVENLPQEFGKGYGEIMAYIGELGIQPVGAPFAIYYNEDMSNLDIEMGFPVADTHPEKGRVKASELPGGKNAVETHIGPYKEVEKTYTKIMDWMKEKGYEAESFCYEVYIDDPQQVPEDKLRTEVYFPIK